jgi:hypothetical protein
MIVDSGFSYTYRIPGEQNDAEVSSLSLSIIKYIIFVLMVTSQIGSLAQLVVASA